MNDINVDEAFMRITKDVYYKVQNGIPTGLQAPIAKQVTTKGINGNNNTANLTSPQQKKKSSWC